MNGIEPITGKQSWLNDKTTHFYTSAWLASKWGGFAADILGWSREVITGDSMFKHESAELDKEYNKAGIEFEKRVRAGQDVSPSDIINK